MGFLSALKKIGKIALKVGKYAAVPALAATGVGIPAAVALGAGLAAADKKASGGTWKQALAAGAMGGATSAIPGGAGIGGAASGGVKGYLGKMAPELIGAGGAMASAVAKGREERRDIEGAQQFSMDAIRNRQTLDSEQATMDAERRRARQMIALDLLGSQSGPSDPRGQKFMSKGMIDPATLERLRGQAFKTTPDISQPQFAALPKSGKVDTFMNVLGAGGSIFDTLKKAGVFNKPEPEYEEIHGTYGNAGY